MKSFTIFLLVVFIAALLTAPGHEQFNKYLAKKGRNAGTCLGGTQHESFKVYSFDYVDYCDSVTGLKKIRTDKYLGLFGMFWKL
jgi:hypothetical protein